MGPELISFQYQFLRTVIGKSVHWYCSLSCGPEGIRTPDLFSAIEARSQLRYRPDFKVQGILPEAKGDVKHRDKLMGAKVLSTTSIHNVVIGRSCPSSKIVLVSS